MTKSLQLTSKIIIIQPGSLLLRIGLASDAKPLHFFNCIGRKGYKNTYLPNVEYKSVYTCTDFDKSNNLTTKNIFDKKFDICNSNNEWNTSLFINSTNDQLKYCGKDFIPFAWSLENVYSASTFFDWPIQNGKFNSNRSPTQILQDLEDMWKYCIENYLGILKNSFHLYSIVLVIEDIFIRREIRQMVNMLLTNLNFARIVVHQSSVCATYGVGLLSACVVDIGSTKTSITCIDEGVSLPELRVALKVGSSDCINTFYRLILTSCLTNTFIADFLSSMNLASFDSFKALNKCLNSADILSIESINNTITSLASVDEIDNYDLLKQKIHLAVPVSNKTEATISVSLNGILSSHILPFFPFGCEDLSAAYQVASLDALEPDDPFDDIYLMMANKDKKGKKNQGLNDGPITKTDENILEVKLQKPNSFKNLAEAIFWSIEQTKNYVFNQEIPTVPISNSVLSERVCTVDRGSSEMMRKMLGSVLLLGGGACGFGGQVIQRCLKSELDKIKTMHPNFSITDAPIEVVVRSDDGGDLAWNGAKLILNTDYVSDLWVNATEWQRYGSRLLRERAPFLW